MRSKLSLSSSLICANISSRSPPDDSIIRTTTYEDKIISCEATEDQAKRKKNEDSLLDSLEDPATFNVEDQEELLGSVGQHQLIGILEEDSEDFDDEDDDEDEELLDIDAGDLLPRTTTANDDEMLDDEIQKEELLFGLDDVIEEEEDMMLSENDSGGEFVNDDGKIEKKKKKSKVSPLKGAGKKDGKKKVQVVAGAQFISPQIKITIQNKKGQQKQVQQSAKNSSSVPGVSTSSINTPNQSKGKGDKFSMSITKDTAVQLVMANQNVNKVVSKDLVQVTP